MSISRFTGLALICVLAVACGGDGSSSTIEAESIETLQLRVVHASPDAGAVDIYVSGPAATVVEDFGYGDTTPFLTVPTGIYEIDIRPASASANSDPVFSVSGVALGSDIEAMTIVAAGLVGAAPGSGREFRLLPLNHEFGRPGATQTMVRIVHASPEADAVKIDVNDDGASEIQLLERFGETGATGVRLPADAALQIGVRLASNDARVTAFTTPELPLDSQIFVIATGLLSRSASEQEGFSLLAVGPEGTIGFVKQNPVIYALHASPDAPPVKAMSGGAELTGPLAFGEMSRPIQVPPGSYPLELVLASNGASVRLDQTPTLAAGEAWLATARGFAADDPGLAIDFRKDEFDRDDSVALARVVHSSPDAPTVEVGAVVNEQFNPLGLPALSYGEESAPEGVPIGTTPLILGLRVPGDSMPAVSFEIEPAPGSRIFALATGSLLDPENKEGFRIALINTSSTPWTLATAQPR
ncbi:MAG: DUF4397 domain-containing protein [Planctomycetota bacterium]|jgi:hypothetical protein